MASRVLEGRHLETRDTLADDFLEPRELQPPLPQLTGVEEEMFLKSMDSVERSICFLCSTCSLGTPIPNTPKIPMPREFALYTTSTGARSLSDARTVFKSNDLEAS